jgi:hypothetical protein
MECTSSWAKMDLNYGESKKAERTSSPVWCFRTCKPLIPMSSGRMVSWASASAWMAGAASSRFKVGRPSVNGGIYRARYYDVDKTSRVAGALCASLVPGNRHHEFSPK